MKKFTTEEALLNLTKISGWVLKNDGIEKEFRFRDFKEAMIFIVKVGEAAESKKHHPEIFNVYNKVHLRLNTHDAGGLTDKDFELAGIIDGI